jgi:hypothetical protein
LTGNPTKTFWKSTYAKYTNFGKQNFRLDYEGSPTLRLNEESTFLFKIKRHADLLMDCYASITLPNIWSPIVPPSTDTGNVWSPYEFKWIENLGAQMISQITITCGNQTIQQYSGQYLLSLVNRDFTQEKKDLFNRMTGNIPELNNPSQTLLTHKNIIEYKEDTVCMRENSFYVDTIRDFRDRRYNYKGLAKTYSIKASEYKKEGNEKKKNESNVLSILYESLQLAHKIILNSSYGYVMKKGARWYSMEMAAMVTYAGAKIIQEANGMMVALGKPLELPCPACGTTYKLGTDELEIAEQEYQKLKAEGALD